MQEHERQQLLVQLVAARAQIDASISMLQKPLVQMPVGVEAPNGGCTHPVGKRHDTYGGHGWCAACGAKW